EAPHPELDPDDEEQRPPVKKPVVYHLFGRFETAKSPPVLSEDDCLDFLLGIGMPKNREKMPGEVLTALTDSGLLFLGFRIDDWSFRVLLHALKRLEGGRRGDYTNVAVQIDPEADRCLEPELARRYVEKYLGDAKVTIYWGTMEAFVTELRDRWAQRGAS